MREKITFIRLTRYFLLLSLLTLILNGCADPAIPETTPVGTVSVPAEEPTDTIHLSIASATSFESLTGQLLRECANEWEEESNGRIHIDLYGGSELGGDELLIQAVTKGTVSIVMMDVNLHSSIVPEASLAGIPLTFSSLEQYNVLMNGSYGDIFKSYYQAKGVCLLANYAVSWKELTTNVPLYTAEDLTKLNIRVFSDPMRQLYWSACGASAGSLAFSELYMALKDGNFNAQENSMEAVYANRFYEVQKYLINSRHLMTLHSFLMNQEQYEALPEDIKEDLERFLQRFAAQYCAKVRERNASFQDLVIENGYMTHLELTPEVKQVMLDARQVLIDELKLSLGEDVVNQYLEAVDDILKKN